MVQYYVYITKRKTLKFLLKRPIQKLILFEIMNFVKEDNKNVSCVTVNRPQRKAAVTGQLKRRMKNL